MTVVSIHPVLQEIINELDKVDIFSLDLETTGFSPEFDRITVVALATREKKWALSTNDFSLQEIREALAPILADASKTLVGHNIKFDLLFLMYAGFIINCRIADTMVMAWLWREDPYVYPHGLKECVKVETGHQMTTFQEASGLFEDLQEYAASDAFQTLKLFDIYVKKLTEIGVLDWFWRVESKITRILVEMEFRGVKLDRDKLKQLKRDTYAELDKAQEKIYQLAGNKFEIGSSQQCAQLLFTEKKIGMRSDGSNKYTAKGKNGEFSTAYAILEAIAADVDPSDPNDPKKIAAALLDHRELNTRNNTFIKPLLERCEICEIIHPRFNQIGTATGRFSSNDPNFQNLPRDGGVRGAFVSRPGYKFVRADFSQAELRLMAHMSQDPTMLAIYRNNGDIHTLTAQACGLSGAEGRQVAKVVNFSIIYRVSAPRLQGQLALPPTKMYISLEESKEYISKYFKKYQGVKRYHQNVERTVLERLRQNGEFGWVKTIGGRYRRMMKDYLSKEETSYTAITQLINATIQGGVSDLVKEAMIMIQEAFKAKGWLDPSRNIWDAYIFNQIHDEILVECKEELAEEAAKIVTTSMENAGKLYKVSVPMLADAKIVSSLAKG